MKYLLKVIFSLFLLMGGTEVLYGQNDALNIVSNGNVGVGTTTPKEKLHVNGNIKTEGRVKDKTGFVMPVGTIMPFAGSKAPEGWLLCDGKAYANTGATKDLYAVIGYTYGSQNGKFRVPNLQGTFIMGVNPSDGNETLGKSGNPDVHVHRVSPPSKSFNTNTTGSHRHKFWPNWYKRNFAGGGYSGIDTNGRNIKNEKTQPEGSHKHSVTVALPAFNSGNSSGKNRPKWMALNYIIKY